MAEAMPLHKHESKLFIHLYEERKGGPAIRDSESDLTAITIGEKGIDIAP